MEDRISESLSTLLMSVEEMRRSDEIDPIGLEEILVRLDELGRLTEDTPEFKDLHKHAAQKFHSIFPHLYSFFKRKEPDGGDPQGWQAALARMAELLLLQRHVNDDEIISVYVDCQRETIRERAKDPISKLVQARQADFRYETDEDTSHVSTLSAILGHAASLMHPLLMWQEGLQDEKILTMIHQSIAALDEQAQKMSTRIIEWFNEDRQLQTWLERESQLDSAELSQLDNTVEEIAFLCQLLDRYLSLHNTNGPISTFAQEYTWKYSTLERFLAVQQYENALAVASPIQIVIDSHIYVPSVIEDATFLSTRSVERAAQTKAIGTVAHAIAFEIWERVQETLNNKKGCWREPSVESAPKSDSAFASALVDALDEDLRSPQKSPPQSGLLSSILSTSDMMDTEFCLLNGIHAASNACRSLVSFLDGLIQEDSADEQISKMMGLAREELFRYASIYDKMLEDEILVAIENFCGKGELRGKLALDELKKFVASEHFDIDSVSIVQADADERLEKVLLDPLRKSDFMEQMSDKCEADVLFKLGQKLVSAIVDLIISSLWEKGSCMTDWGSLLLSKQVRTLQAFVAEKLTPNGVDASVTASSLGLVQAWERLSQVVAILQLEKPADWIAYQSTSLLSSEQTQMTMSLRKDFSPDAIENVVNR